MDAKLNDVNEPCLTLGTGEVKDSPSKKAKAHLESSTAKPKETDVFRDTPVRLLGKTGCSGPRPYSVAMTMQNISLTFCLKPTQPHRSTGDNDEYYG